MKKSKVLVPALGVLCLGMAAAVSGTVAWYAANTTVSASGITVQATVARNLVITNADKNTWAASALAKTTAQSVLEPVSAANVNSYESFFVGGPGEKVDYNTGKLQVGATVSRALDADYSEGINSSRVRVDTFYVKLDAADTVKTPLSLASLSVGAPAQNISKALRVGIVCGDIANIYSLVTGSDPKYNALSAAGTVETVNNGAYQATGSAALTTETTPLAEFSPVVVKQQNEFSGGTEVKCTVLTWYEGTDSHCTSANSINAEAVSINLSFSIAAVQA